MARLTYEEMGDITDPIQMAYLDAVAKAPRAGSPGVTSVIFEGYPTTDVLLSLWEAHRVTILAAFEAGGWTENEFEDEILRRLEAQSA